MGEKTKEETDPKIQVEQSLDGQFYGCRMIMIRWLFKKLQNWGDNQLFMFSYFIAT